MSDSPTVLRGGDDTSSTEDEAPHDKPEDWMVPARSEGHDWSDIGEHVATASDAAIADGHSQGAVDEHLGYASNLHARTWMERTWDSMFGETPPDGKINLTTPTLRDDYAHALTENSVKDAGDFSDTYAAAALDAAGKHIDVDDNHRRQVAAAAEGLAATLPDRHDFVDAAVSVTDSPEDAERVRKELVNRWKDTGTSPYDLVKTETDLNKHPGGDDPGLQTRAFLNTTAGIVGIADGIFSIPHAVSALGDWGLEKLGISGEGEGFLTRHTDFKSLYSFEDSFRKGMDVIDKTFGGNGLNLTPHSTPERLATEFLSFAIPMIATAGASTLPELAGAAGKATRFGAYTTAALEGLNQIFPDGDRVGDVVKLLAMGTIAHVTAGKPINHFSPDETGGPAIKPIGPEGYTRNDLAHAEAQEMAADPNFARRLAADESGEFNPRGEGGDVAARKIPKFSFEEKPGTDMIEDALVPNAVNKQFLLHKDGEPVGYAHISFPEDTPGHARIENIASDDRAGALGPRAVKDLSTQFFAEHPDAKSITGLRITGARMREGSGPSEMTITRDQIEKPMKPAEVQALAESYHTTDNLLGSWLSDVKGVLGSDSGAFNLNKFPQFFGPSAREKAAFDQSRTARRVFTSTWTKTNAEAKQWKTFVQRQLDKTSIGTFVSKNMAEAKAAMALATPADRAAAFRKSQLGQLEMAINGQVPIAPNHPMYEPVMFMKRVRDFMHMEATQWHLDGFLPKTDYVKGYTQGLWESPNAKWEEAHATERNPFGDTRYLKDKKYQDKFQGIQAGEIPKYLDPVQHLAHEVMNHAKQSIKMNMLSELTKAFPGSRIGMQPTANPPPFLMPLKGTEYGNKVGYAPKGFAEKWNSQFDAGLLSDPFQEKTLTSLQKVVGIVNQIKLLWPMFHLRTMIMATWADTLHEVEAAALGVAKGAIHGDMSAVADQSWRALKSLATGVPVLPKIAMQVLGKGREGFKWYTETDPTVAKSLNTLAHDDIHEAIRDGGFGYSRGLENMVGHEPSLHKSIIRNIDRNDSVIGNIKNQARAFAQTQMEKWNTAWGVGTDESVARRTVNASLRLPSWAVEETARAGQTFGHFAFDYLIPRMQYGAIYESAASWKARNPGYTPSELRDFVRQQIMDQENRKGELNMVNVFWPKLWKQSASLAMLSTGWKFGTYRGLAQAAGWDPDQGRWRLPLVNNPTAVMGALNTAASWAAMNALHQYINDGTLPTQTDTPWKDLALFRTGTQGKRMGSVVPLRGMNPGEPKEVYDLAHILFTALGNPSKLGSAISEYAMASTNPLWQVARAVITDEDAIGHKIGEYPGGWPRFLQSQFLPMISDSNIWDRKDSGIPFWEQKWLGTREAASWAENPPGYQKFLEEKQKKDQKAELKRARHEASTYENMQWLEEYIKQAEAEQENAEAKAHVSTYAAGLRQSYRHKTQRSAR